MSSMKPRPKRALSTENDPVPTTPRYAATAMAVMQVTTNAAMTLSGCVTDLWCSRANAELTIDAFRRRPRTNCGEMFRPRSTCGFADANMYGGSFVTGNQEAGTKRHEVPRRERQKILIETPPRTRRTRTTM